MDEKKLFKYIDEERIDEAGLTRKHFTRTAKILKEHKASKDMVEAFAEWFAEENPMFNKQKFMEAAGIK